MSTTALAAEAAEEAAPGLDDGGSPLLDGGDEGIFQPSLVADDGIGIPAFDFSVMKLGVLGGGMVAPDGHVGYRGNLDSCFLGELCFGPVLVQTGHGEPPICRHVPGVVHGDEAIGVAGVSDYEDAHVGGGVILDGPALSGKYFAIDAEEVVPFHIRTARHAAHQQAPVGAFETHCWVQSGLNIGQQGKSAIVQFHYDAFEGVLRRGNSSTRFRATGWSGPNMEPDAIRKRRE